jgi:ATP-dependent Clp protease ATP-binding subunit ClpC
MNREISPKLKVIINNSMREAKLFDDTKIRVEHLVLSVINDIHNDCIDKFIQLRVDLSELTDTISDYLRKNDLTPRITTNIKGRIPFSDEVITIFNNVDKECEKLNDKIVEPTHLILTILSTPSPITKILFDANVTYLKLKNLIMDEKTGEIKNDRIDEDFNDDFNDDTDRIKKVKKKGEYSKTPVLDNFCRDVSKAAEKGEIDPVVGREKEIKRISQILSRRKKNNPILIGDPGVGKCICSDTEVVMRNDLTGEIIKITIFNLLNNIANT